MLAVITLKAKNTYASIFYRLLQIEIVGHFLKSILRMQFFSHLFLQYSEKAPLKIFEALEKI
ncbi:hypothetical protein SAMN04487999_0621 [Leeuwenhoekiella palythoae]|uniref:Uncharacterized protein n=1 Tax=Leeuwenhoekiella palythoae TaxID=573501 RepID=A0A1M5UC08_9FLAO|nr:hypothetical protein SAMN04487999_0621 [Leeuwenhoekiella palythoae]